MTVISYAKTPRGNTDRVSSGANHSLHPSPLDPRPLVLAPRLAGAPLFGASGGEIGGKHTWARDCHCPDAGAHLDQSVQHAGDIKMADRTGSGNPGVKRVRPYPQRGWPYPQRDRLHSQRGWRLQNEANIEIEANIQNEVSHSTMRLIPITRP